MSIRTYPTSTSNKNVPADVYLIAEVSTMSGEIITTYYANDKGTFAVCDWVLSKPYPVDLAELAELTDDDADTVALNIGTWRENVRA